MSNDTPRIRVGIGGWNFAEWRGGAFYPAGLPAARELHFASRQLTSIEINATFYATQTPATCARWRDETPDGFQFAVKANRFATQRKTLSDGADSVVHASGSTLSFNGTTGELLRGSAEPSLATAIGGSFYGLHMGHFAGPVLRWLYLICGLAGTAMIGTGPNLVSS